MEWYGWIAWGVSIAASGYSAWRWWKEDRNKKAVEPLWEIRHFQNDAYVLATKLPYTATEVTLSADTFFPIPIEGATFTPRTEKRFMPRVHMGFPSGSEFTVTWSRPKSKKLHTEVLLLPPKQPRQSR
ncbi:hypothetical protein [Leucobacter sp. M11]|uniref:hypothetical protein n=1 Tax=Leucobacter sp. M11 TaxID=2993565 RepID=UPI002D7EAD6A|nr:hypothetical protein [Leucobacter sp. M11]MEB4614038.1 hypothetical protein [Leucobacter sp. M11]